MEPQFTFEDVFQRMRRRRAKIEPHDSKERFEKLGVDVFEGKARFVSPNEVEVDGSRLSATNFVIATGTKALVLPIEGLDTVPFYTNETLFDEMPTKPSSILILGGGPIGCEFAQVMSRLGVEVTLVELLPRLLPRDDPEAGSLIEKRLREEGIEVLTETKAIAFKKQDQKILTQVERGQDNKLLETEALLVATGRRPNVEGLGLEAAGVEYDRRGIKVDRTLTTSQSHIFACGDIAGPYQFTHTADYQARIVVRNILVPWKKVKADYTWVPWVTFTDPEVAQVGLTEDAAQEKSIPYSVHRFDWDGLDRAITDSEETGFIKVLAPPGKDKILGATVVGVHAGDVLHELVVAAKHGVGLSKLSATIHAYPTLSQSVQRVADTYQRTKLTPRVAGIFRWLYRRRRS
jgi:pyruvate/2-oxoglutarate dehydrogenase complex dihydrolipoamide dehydrogenase (E3) component